MAQLEFMLATVTTVLIAAWFISRFVLVRETSRDLVWRLALIVVAATPVLALVRDASSSWQWSIPILPGETPAAKVESETPVAGFRPAAMDRAAAGRSTAIRSARLEQIPPEAIPEVGAGADEIVVKEPATAPPVVTSPLPVPRTVTWPILAGCVWGVGALLLGLRFAVLVRNAQRLVAGAVRVDEPSLIDLNRQAADAVGVRRPARLLASARVGVPIVSGLGRPKIIIPQTLLAGETRAQLRAILLHEYGHIRRCDLVFETLLRLVVAAFWPHPMIHLMARELRRLREEICDNYALGEQSPVTYSELLLQLSIGALPGDRRLAGLGMLSKHRLEARIDAILAADRRVEVRPPRATSWLLSGATCLLMFAAVVIRLDRAAAAPPQATATPPVQSDDEPVAAPIQRNAAAPSQEPHEFQFRVVDTSGAPVAGATVAVQGLSFVTGSGFEVNAADQAVGKSDAEGNARLVFTPALESVVMAASHYARRPLPPNNVVPPAYADPAAIRGLRLRVDHPDHPALSGEFLVLGDRKIVMADAVTVQVRAKRDGNFVPAKRLYPLLSNTLVTDWTAEDDLLTIRRVDLTSTNASRWLRIVQVPEEGPASFSEVINLKRLPGNPISFEVTLRPGVRVRGRLGNSVPRPVKNGRVFALAADLAEETQRGWTAVAAVAADGTFVLESIPAGEYLQVVALCDGWVSRSPKPLEESEFIRLHDLPASVESVAVGWQVLPQLYDPQERLIVAMEPTAACEVTVLDGQGRPVADAQVAFSPNQQFRNLSESYLGAMRDMASLIRERLVAAAPFTEPEGPEAPLPQYLGKTDQKGVVVISGLPAGNEERPATQQAFFLVWREGYEPASPPPLESTFPMQLVTLETGRTARVTVHLVPVSPPGAPAGPGAAAGGADRARLSGRVVDQDGKPLAGVNVGPLNEESLGIVSDKEGRFLRQFDEPPVHDEEGAPVPSVPARFVKEGYATSVASISFGVDDQVITLRNDTYFEGVIRTADGAPAPNVRIVGFDQHQLEPLSFEERMMAESRSDDQGRYRLLVEPGQHLIAAGNSSAAIAWLPRRDLAREERPLLPIRAGEAKPLDIRLEPGVDVVVRILDSVTREPVPEAYMSQDDFPGQGEFVKYVKYAQKPATFGIRSLPAGPLKLHVSAEGYLRGWSEEASPEWKQAARDSVGADATRGAFVRDDVVFDLKPGMAEVTVLLEKAATLNGRVVDPDGQPVPGATVSLIHPNGSLHRDGSWSTRARADGNFSLSVPPSDGRQCNLVARDDPGDPSRRPALGLPNGDVTRQAKWASGLGPLFQVTPGETIEGIELRLSHPGAILGRIVDAQGQPVAGIAVYGMALDEGRTAGPRAESGRDGTFLLQPLRAGRHRLRVNPEAARTGPPRRSATGRQEDDPIVTVVAGETTNAGDVAEK